GGATPTLLGATQLVRRPVAFVELERDDADRAVPGHRAQAHRGAVLTPAHGCDERVQIAHWATIDLDDALAGPELVASRRRAVRKVGHEYTVRLDAALSCECSVRLLQYGASPHYDAIEVATAEHHGRRVDDALRAITQHSQAHARLLHGSLDFAKAVHELAVDIEKQIAGTQQPVGRRAAHQARHAQNLAPFGGVLFEAADPFIGQSQLARARKRRRQELRFQRTQLSAFAHHAQRLEQQLGRYAAVLLVDLASGLVSEARPRGDHLALLVRQHAVIIGWPVDQADGLEVGLAKLQRSGQWERHGIDRGHGGGARLHLAVRAQTHRPHRIARPQIDFAKACGAHRRGPDQ